jgi:uncharacterized membrane protein YphA (DoxX/SURF4 family)
MQIAVAIVRTLIGLLFLMASVTYFLNLVPEPELTGGMKTFSEGLTASGYLMPLVKIIELLCGIAFLSGRFVPLAIVLIAPVVLNILLVNVFLAPEGLPIAIALFAGILFLAYTCRSNYQTLFAVK